MRGYLAIDQSTSATKALLFGDDGALIDQVALPHRQIYPQPGWVEHDAEEIYRNTVQVLGELAARHPLQVAESVSLSITNQRETFALFDRKTGAPLHNAIVWLCRRGEAICRRLVEAGHESAVHVQTGLKIDTYFPASKLAWLLDARPDLRQQLADGDALFGTIDAYLIYRLTNGRTFATDQTNASRTLLFDIHQMTWDAELCALFGVPQVELAEVRDSNAGFGETDFGGLLPRPLPICGVMGDSQAALFAQRCITPGSAKVTFGTGSSVLFNIGPKAAYSDNGLVTAVAWVLNGEPTYALEGITNFTGATIVWLRDQLGLIQTVEETEGLATAVPDTCGVYLVPAFVGLGAPYWQPQARAAIVGLTPASTKNHVVRAALEGIAYTIRDVLDLMAQDGSVALQHIHADGGAVNNHFLMQFVADVTRLPLRAANLPELSALGAVFAGTLGLGIHGSVTEIAALPHGYVEYKPRMETAMSQTLYAGWRRAIDQVLAG